jgi:hypothetical protein
VTLNEIIEAGMNNPECSLFVGATYGQLITVQNVAIILMVYALFKVVNKLALEPLVEWVKKKYDAWKK